MTERIVVTAGTLLTALGGSLSETWTALLRSRTGIGPLQDLGTGGSADPAGARVRAPDPAALGISHRDARIMGLHSLILMQCTRSALTQAGIQPADFAAREIAFFAGVGMVDPPAKAFMPALARSGDGEAREREDFFFKEGYRDIHPLVPLTMLNNIALCQVASALGIRGENALFSPFADAGANAIAEGRQTLLTGKARIAVTGGVSDNISPASLARYHLRDALAKKRPGEKIALCRPFARCRNGTLLGEGGAVLVLETESSALQRRVAIRAVLSGSGAACGLDPATRAPAAEAFEAAMQNALSDADLEPRAVDLVIAQADGGRPGDRHEMDAIEGLFSAQRTDIAVFSSKGALGNLQAGSATADAVLGLRILQTGKVPATVNCTPLEEHWVARRINTAPRSFQPGNILINSAAPHGQCISLVLSRVGGSGGPTTPIVGKEGP